MYAASAHAGDGKKLDTASINKAVKACADAGGGQVRFGPGGYLSGTVHGRVVFRDTSIEYTSGGTAKEAKSTPRKPGVDARSLPVWGFYAKNARDITLENVHLYCAKEDLRPAIVCEDVDRLVLDAVRFPKVPNADGPIVLKNVQDIKTRDVDVYSPEPARQK